MTLIAFLGIVMVVIKNTLDILNKYPSVKVFLLQSYGQQLPFPCFIFSPQQNGKRGRGNNEKHNNKQVS